MAKSKSTFFASPVVDRNKLTGLPGPSFTELQSILVMPKNEASCLPSLMTADELKSLIEKLVHNIWKEKGTPAEIDKALTEFFASEYWKAVQEGYGVNIEEVDFDTPDYEMLKSLEKSVYQFSSAKGWQMGKAISQALLDEAGKLRTFTQFRTAAAAINNEFVNQWLRAEYNYAVASSRSAAHWLQIQKDKEILKILVVRTAGDDRVRLTHQDFEGIRRHVDDYLWTYFFPPFDWECRCGIQQETDGIITPMDKIHIPENRNKMFNYNPGISGIAFPPDHPYYDGLPDDVKKQGILLWKEKSKL